MAMPALASEPAVKVLVVDDDRRVRDLLTDFLNEHGFSAESAKDGATMDALMADRAYDVVVLDLMMPGEDGLSICRRLSMRPGPSIIMLSAMGEDTDRIVGLELGADDYLPKPCNPRELLARIKAVMRRRGEAGRAPAKAHSAYVFDGWRFDPVQRMLTGPDGLTTSLSNGEFLLLKALMDHPNQILGREALMKFALINGAEIDGRSVDVQVSRLRRKLDDSDGRKIRTFRGAGYMFLPKVTRE